MNNYPALLDLATQALHPIGVSESFLVGRNETADICVLDLTCSRHHFRIVRRDGHYFVEPLSTVNPTYCNGQPIKKSEALDHGAILQAGQTRFQFLLRAANASAADKYPIVPAATILAATVETAARAAGEFPLSGSMLIGRDPGNVQIMLPHPQVSRRHASIAMTGNSNAMLADLNSANGTFVNGQPIRASVTLNPGDQVDIGPFALQFTGTALIPKPRSDNIELIARGVTRIVKNRETGKPMTLLDGVNLVVRPREFVCLLGPSGSGKSTLLSALSGRDAVDDGAVLLNGKDLYANFEAMKQDIAVVPQQNVLHDSLTVDQALWYTAKLRLPPDTSAAEIEASLIEMLDTVGLAQRRRTVIRHLSGGQAKRASLANEILCKPSLVFLDEVTSGLDEQTDREVMRLFRSLADAGKTVVCITHSLANVEPTCHVVVILTPGGKLAFVGKPAEALAYFGIQRLGDVYDRLSEHPPEHWQQAFLKSPHWKRYVADRMPPEDKARERMNVVRSVRRTERLRMFLRQAILLTLRYAAIWRSDFRSLAAMAGQAVVVALLLVVLFGNIDEIPRFDLKGKAEYAGSTINLMFLLAVSSFWFGCNNAAKEIVKERTIYTRERDFNLRVGSYYTSKLLLLTAFSWLQTILLFTIVGMCCRPPGSLLIELIVLLALALAGVTMGLAISAFATTEEMAITLIPMVVIPQIILSGTISPLSGLSKALALVGVSTYWGKRGLDAALPAEVAWAVLPEPLAQDSSSAAVLVLVVHATAWVMVTLAVMQWQSRRKGLVTLLGK